MARWRKITAVSAAALLLVLLASVLVLTRAEAYRLVTNPAATRNMPSRTPATLGLSYEDVMVTTEDGLRLVGWHLPSTNGATVIVQHGYKDSRSTLLGIVEVFQQRGFGVLITTVRAHDGSDGEGLTFGLHEMKDLRREEFSRRVTAFFDAHLR